jgi:hypothetical protein
MTLNISFGQTFNFTNILVISFGATNWRSQDFTVELSSGGTYSTLDVVTGFTESDYSIKFLLPSPNSFDGCRITFSNFFNTSSPSGFRIADISLLKFNSDGPKSLYVGRDGGEIYKQIQITGGTVSTPSYSTLNDVNTGFYFPTGGTIGFVANGIERMRIGSTGNVGVGTTSPTQKLHVSGNTLISGSLTANTITLVGNNQTPSLNTTVIKTLTNGNNTIYSIPTSTYTGAFFDYTLISSGSTGARSGTIMSIWSGSTAQFLETTTPSIGSTTGVTFSVAVSGSNAILSSSATTAGWVVKTIVRTI